MGCVNLDGYTRTQALGSVGSGWATLINRLYDAKPDHTKVVQVKEKFGGLRFYITDAPKEFHMLIRKAETESYSLCEICGAEGSLDDNHPWIKTWCDPCKEKEKSK